MNTIIITLAVAFILVLLCVSMMGISSLLTGKSRFRMGMCGRVPTEKKDGKKGCGSTNTCGICGKGNNEPQEEE